ncbi:hypothetical protein FKP32DRAFT_1594765 [Trametes sanguinea]|nr:hypothetical protein FKP32DRAFT_1594765 [Trametes sanguinea]
MRSKTSLRGLGRTRKDFGISDAQWRQPARLDRDSAAPYGSKPDLRRPGWDRTLHTNSPATSGEVKPIFCPHSTRTHSPTGLNIVSKQWGQKSGEESAVRGRGGLYEPGGERDREDVPACQGTRPVIAATTLARDSSPCPRRPNRSTELVLEHFDGGRCRRARPFLLMDGFGGSRFAVPSSLPSWFSLPAR